MTVAEYNMLRCKLEGLLSPRLGVSASRPASEVLSHLYKRKTATIDPTSSIFRTALIFHLTRRSAHRETFDLVDNWLTGQGLATSPPLDPNTHGMPEVGRDDNC